MAKVLLVLYPDPVSGYPPVYARDSVPVVQRYPGGQSLPSPSGIDFTPGKLVGCVSGALGLRKFLEDGGHQLAVTSDKEGPDSEFERELPDADIVISQPFWPAYLTAERIAKAPNLKLAITAGIGSDMWTSTPQSPAASPSPRSPTATASASPSTPSCRSWRWCATLSPHTNGRPTGGGISPTASHTPTTSRGWTWE
jgi:hypothetical protein